MAVWRCWSLELTIANSVSKLQIADGFEISRQSVADIYLRLRDVCTTALDKKNIKLGGRGHVVQIDES